MTCTVLRGKTGELASMTFTCDHEGGCDAAPTDTAIEAAGGLTMMGWECPGGKHYCPEHRLTPLPRPAIADIAKERERQIVVEGFTPESNDHYEPGTLASAAACYAAGQKLVGADGTPVWPWGDEWWKPGPTRRRDMEKAGALIAAEIEHIDRSTASNEE